MIICEKCKSPKTKVLPTKLRDIEGGKTRKRECLSCGFQFVTLEKLFVFPVITKRKPKKKIESKKLSRRGKRILRPVPEPKMPDFDSMTDDELEAWIFRND